MKRILITRASLMLLPKSCAMQALNLSFPVIEIQPITNNVAGARTGKLDCYDWLVFTSVNAVDVVFDLLGTAMDPCARRA